MATTKTALGVIGTAAVMAIGALIYTLINMGDAKTALAASGQRLENLRAKQNQLQRQITAQTERAAAVEADNAKLQKAIQPVQTAIARPAPGSAAHRDLVKSRFQRGKASFSDGHLDAALKEFLWCYDEGTAGEPSFTGDRWTALKFMAQIAEKYPPALAALRARRDWAEQEMLATPNDRTAATVIATVNNALGENSRTLALFNQLPPGDPRRQGFLYDPWLQASLFPLFDQLLEARRYADVAATYPYEQMDAHFERSIQENRSPGILVKTTTRAIEVLAGAGQLAQARALAGKLLSYDGSTLTRAALQKHLERARQPGLLATLPK